MLNKRVKKINGKYYDFGTSNKSFLLTANELKFKGIKNYYFMLEIKNPAIVGLDPFNENLTDNEIALIMQEANLNCWYYGRELARIPTPLGPVPLELHRGLCAKIWLALKHFTFLYVGPRQTYKTTGFICAVETWAFQIGTRNTTFLQLGMDADNTQKQITHIQEYISLLPKYMRYDEYIDSNGKIKKTQQAAKTVRNSVLRNFAIMTASANSEEKAATIGRGKSTSCVTWDEFEFTPYCDIILGMTSPAYKTASDNAIKAGFPSYRALLSTPGDLDSETGSRAKEIIDTMIPFNEELYDFTDDEIQNYMKVNQDELSEKSESLGRGTSDIFYVEYSFLQLRKTWKWVDEQAKLSGNIFSLRRDILLERLRGSNNSPISPEDIDWLKDNVVKSTKETLLMKKWPFKLYDHLKDSQQATNVSQHFSRRIPYMVGVDPATGGGGDYISITVVNPLNLKIAAEFRHKFIKGPDLARLLVYLVIEFIPNACVIIERNSLGDYLIQTLCETIIKKNLYWSRDLKQLDRLVKEDPALSTLVDATDMSRQYGTWMGTKTRTAFIELMFLMLAQYKELIYGEYLVENILSLTKSKTGKILAEKNKSDDSLFSWLHVMYVYFYGDNLHSFNINKIFDIMLNPDDNPSPPVVMDVGFLTNSKSMEDEDIRMSHIIHHEKPCDLGGSMIRVNSEYTREQANNLFYHSILDEEYDDV